MSVKNYITEFITDVKMAVMTATGTVGMGLTQILDLIPDNIGKLGTLIGIILSGVLIFVHIRNGTIQNEKNKLEMQILKKKLKEID